MLELFYLCLYDFLSVFHRYDEATAMGTPARAPTSDREV